MQKKYHYYFKQPLGPTQFNLIQQLNAQGWKSTWLKSRALFGDTNLDFHKEAAECLEFKHNLAQLLQVYGLEEFMPLSFCINDFNWPHILNKLPDGPWILKPSLLNNGQHLKIFDTIHAIKAHFLTKNRLGGEHVLQQYIASPHLLRDQRKYSIRVFLLLTNDKGAYLYPEGYFNVAKHPYVLGSYDDLRPHFTNEHLYATTANVIQIPTNQFAWFPPFYETLQNQTRHLVAALCQKYPKAFQQQPGEPTKLGLFGLDFMIDSTSRLWFLEANHGPCFPTEATHPLQAALYRPFWKTLMTHFVLPPSLQTLENPAPWVRVC